MASRAHSALRVKVWRPRGLAPYLRKLERELAGTGFKGDDVLKASTRSEQETAFRWDEDEKVVHVWSASPVTWRKLTGLGIEPHREGTAKPPAASELEVGVVIPPRPVARWSATMPAMTPGRR